MTTTNTIQYFYPTVMSTWYVWCQTCLAAFPCPHTCPSVNVDVSKQYPTVNVDKPFTYTTSPGWEPPTLETRVLQLEARILNQQDWIEQLTNRVENLEEKAFANVDHLASGTPLLTSQHSYDCPYTGVSAHTEHLCPWPPNDE